ncbi:hypothetical protein EV382_2889 [Micromonospora violae]|uniref:Uncharacterized protein n=1 Tax=Micromonospora violae TaxID=1278207 RepID=A0A4Q7UEL6_9ACTN|nr:hypothetical protein EV382_2889 [Micromonospora violae]
MTTQLSATARAAGTSSCSATRATHDASTRISHQPAFFHIRFGEAKERTMQEYRPLSRAGQPPDGGA